MVPKIENSIPILFFGMMLLVVVPLLAYWPGIEGGFLVDDFSNLEPLGYRGGIKDLDTLRFYIFGGDAGPTGRPLSLLTFVIDSQTWPADPHSFKYTNILLHVLNGIILFAVIVKLFQLIGKDNDTSLVIAFFSAMAWLIQPLHVSTVLYIIQRMVEVSALFTLAGLWCYLYGRQRLNKTPGPAYLWMTVGVLVFGLLATFSKENGALLPLYILVLEITVLSCLAKPEHWKFWAAPMLITPVVCLLFYFGYVVLDHHAKFMYREFSLYERILTEPRVLFGYLGKIAFPIDTPSLNNDDYLISKSLFSPFTTIISLAGVVVLLVVSMLFRKNQPVISFAILWFFAGHIMESTVLPLEIEFEHRSYLPMVGFVIAFFYYAMKFARFDIRYFSIGLATLLAVEFFITWGHSNTWESEDRLVAAWAEEKPNSVRANSLYAIQLYKNGDKQNAFSHLSKTMAMFPAHLGTRMLYTMAGCELGRLKRSDMVDLVMFAEILRVDSLVIKTVMNIAKSILSGRCNQIDFNDMAVVIRAIMYNKHAVPLTENKKASLYILQSNIYAHLKNFNDMAGALNKAFMLSPSIDLALKQALILNKAGHVAGATHYLYQAEILDGMRNRLLPSKKEEIDWAWKVVKDRTSQIDGSKRVPG